MNSSSGFKMLDVVFVGWIIAFSVFFLTNIYSSTFIISCIKIPEKNLIRRICEAIISYEGDLGAFPPDRGDLEVNATNPTPTKPIQHIGLLNNTISDYSNDNLLRHLDGNSENDADTGLQDYVTSRPLDCYITLNPNEMDCTNVMKPKIITLSGTSLYYNEKNKGISKKTSKSRTVYCFF